MSKLSKDFLAKGFSMGILMGAFPPLLAAIFQRDTVVIGVALITMAYGWWNFAKYKDAPAPDESEAA